MNEIEQTDSLEDFASTDDDVIEVEAEKLNLLLDADPGEVADIGAISPENWRDYPDVVTDSLWIIGSRGRAGMHSGGYHGNFVPQIPYQAIRRFTKPGDVVLDVFLGSGTTLIECRRQGRHGIGVELNSMIAERTRGVIEAEENRYDTWQRVITGDSSSIDTRQAIRDVLAENGRDEVQLIMMHPPYDDIIQFSDDGRDLSNAGSTANFLAAMKRVAAVSYDLLAKDGFVVVVIGDKYANQAWVPLGFYTLEAVRSVGYVLKSIVVKNMEGNRAKRNLQNFWRQRAFRGLYYIFKHEYVFFLQKVDMVGDLLRDVMALVRVLDDREELGLITKSSLVSGECLGELLADYDWLGCADVLALKQGQLRAVVLDLTGVMPTDKLKFELETFISCLPEKVVDVSLLVKRHTELVWRGVGGVSQVYGSDRVALERLAHTLYAIRKALSSGKQATPQARFAFAIKLGEALGGFFERGQDYKRVGGGLWFFGDDGTVKVRIETKWVNGHEAEKWGQLQEKYQYQAGVMVAVLGHNRDDWQRVIKKQGGCADYYLFVDKKGLRDLGTVVETEVLFKGDDEGGLVETSLNLVGLLK